MSAKKKWSFPNYETIEQQWYEGKFDCDDIADFNDPLVLDWCSRIDDWAPKVALCFNRYTSAVTLDRISQSEMAELRRLVCFHRNTSMETLERLLTDGDRETRETAQTYLERRPKATRTSQVRA